MSILSAIKQESSSLEELAKLPQTLIMQMAQNGQISKEMVAPILGKKSEMADAAARMRAMQQAGQNQSVMEQVMQKNAQAENPIPQIPTQMEQTGVAQIPVREPQYAGGGIVAFAGGGMYDTEAAEGEESEAQEMARLFPKSKLASLIESGASGLRGLVSKMKGSPVYDKAAADMKQAAEMKQAEKPKGNHPYEADAIKAAKQVGLDPSIMLHALYKESGGTKDPATARSKAGAYGPMQLMPATAKELGVDYKDPQQNIIGGATYLKKQLDAFKDPQLALAAYNAGPGAVRKALSSNLGIASLPKETQGYMRYAAGGDIKGYSGEDRQSLVDADYQSDFAKDYAEDNPYLARSRALNEKVRELGRAFTNPRNYDPVSKLIIDPLASLKKWGQTPLDQQAAKFEAASNARKNRSFTNIEPPKVEPKPDAAKSVPAKADATKAAPAPTNIPPSLVPAVTKDKELNAPALSDAMADPQKSAEQSYFDELRQYIMSGREEAKAARKENQSLALLQAGLGMLGGTSPYAMANIGQGAMQGVQAYGQGQKGIREQERDLMSAQLGMAKYKSAAENAAAERAATAAYRDAVLGQKGEGAEAIQSDRAYTRLQQIEKDIANRVQSQYNNNPMYKLDPNKFNSEIEAKILAEKQKSKLYNSLYTRAMGVAPDFSVAAPAPADRPPLSDPRFRIK
jgi:hypothetical protein